MNTLVGSRRPPGSGPRNEFVSTASRNRVAAFVHSESVYSSIGGASLDWIAEHRSALPRTDIPSAAWPAAIVVELDGRVSDEAIGRWLLQLRATGRREPVIICMPFTSRHVHRLVPLLQAGASDVILLGLDDPARSVTDALRSAQVLAAMTAAIADAGMKLPERIEKPIAYCLRQLCGSRPISTSAVSALLRGCPRERAAVATTHVRVADIVAWARLLAAAHAIQRGRTVADAARTAGCFDSAALRHLLGRHSLGSPKTLRQSGAFLTVVMAFAEHCGGRHDR